LAQEREDKLLDVGVSKFYYSSWKQSL